MPLYYFVLKNGRDVIAEKEGVDLPDHEAARAEAVAVARELMFSREPPTRKWRLEVQDDYLNPCGEVLFAEVDETIAHLPLQYRRSIESIARLSASLDDAFCAVHASLRDVRETLARAEGIIAAGVKPRPDGA